MTAAEAEATLLPDLRLPVPRPEEDELEDVRWFHKSFLKATVIDGKRILGAEVPGVAGAAFNSPGEYSLAGKAIKEWIMRDGCVRSSRTVLDLNLLFKFLESELSLSIRI